MLKIVLLLLIGLGGAYALARFVGVRRWRAASRTLTDRLEHVRAPITPARFHPEELDGLPAPVQRYFGAVLTAGQPMISAAQVRHTGMFNLGGAGGHWKRFTSDQFVALRRPGFVWDARIALLPGLTVYVHDAYVAGEGVLKAALLGWLSLADTRGTPELAEGELMRFLAEAPWYPTALLPSQGLHWEPVDETSARATLGEGDARVKLLFRFDAQGLVESVRAEARGRRVKGRAVPTPWEGRWRDYQWRDGMQVPLEGEVAWILAEGPRPYWRGRITRLAYTFAGTSEPAGQVDG